MEDNGTERPPLWDAASAETAATLTRAIDRFNEALDTCVRQLNTEEELEETWKEVEALPTIPPTQ
jgi:vacuolar-type H+-ATPase subunit D/Vma8